MGSPVSAVIASLYMERFEDVDDIFTILDRENLDGFLQHLNNQQDRKPNNSAEPPTSSKLLRFYLMSKVCLNSFAVAYNNKAYALFSSRRLR